MFQNLPSSPDTGKHQLAKAQIPDHLAASENTHLKPVYYGHRSEVRRGVPGVGRHFQEVHGKDLDLSKRDGLAQCLESFSLQVIATVRPPATPEEEPACRLRVDRLEADMQHRLRCMQESGGLNIRDENSRKRNQ